MWFAAILLAAAAGLAALYPGGDPDVFFHLATGREIALNASIPDSEPFCFPSEGKPFVNHEWVFDAALWGAYAAGGDVGVTLFKAAAAALLFGLIAILGRRMGAGAWPMVLAGLAFLPLFRSSLEARPHVAGYALAAAVIICLYDLERGRRLRLAVLAVLMALWANTHGSFPLGIALWGIFAARTLARGQARTGAGMAVLSAGPLMAVSCLFNPWGIGIVETVIHHAEPIYREIVPEWGPVRWGEQPARDLLYLALAASVLLSFAPRANRRRVSLLALVILFLAQASLSVKFTLGLAVGAVPVLAANMSALKPAGRGTWRATGAVLSAASILFLTPLVAPWRGPGLGFDLRDFPVAALEHAEASGVSGRLFNPFNQGGYCEFRAYPGLRTFIDGRAYVHGLDGIRAYLGALSDYGNFRRLDTRYSFDAVLVDIQDPSFPRLAAGLAADPRFAMTWLDSHFALFVPGGENPYQILRPTTDPRYVFDLDDGSVGPARAEVSRLRGADTGKTMGPLLSGVLRLREAGAGPTPESLLEPGVDPAACDRAVPDFAALVEVDPDAPMFRYFHAAALACAGRCDEAGEEASVAAGSFPDAAALASLIEEGRCRRRGIR